jgi:hypothetical protein
MTLHHVEQGGTRVHGANVNSQEGISVNQGCGHNWLEKAS